MIAFGGAIGVAETRDQVSAGGVVFRHYRGRTQVVLISVATRDGLQTRWQLPKGLVGRGEVPEAAAEREVREEAGVVAERLTPLAPVEYWYYGTAGRGANAPRVRFHKLVYFYLFRYRAGKVADHDQEVVEARWVPLEEAEAMLAFAGEKKVVREAAGLIAAMGQAK
jgi:8-oxo-dGTP pyrophosphatase MutT (NUDIX family)